MSRKSKADERKLFSFPDFFVIFGVLILLVVLFMLSSHKDGDELYAEISVKGEKVESIAFSNVKEEYTLYVEGTEILVSSQGVRFVTSPCKDRICVDRGLINRAGESAVCLPQRVSVRIVSGAHNSGSVDAVAG